MTRIVLIGSRATFALENFYRNALEGLGHEVALLDPDASIPRALNQRALARLTWSLRPLLSGRSLMLSFEADARWDAVVVFKGLFLPASCIAHCRALTPKARWANLNPDNPWSEGRASSSAHVRAAIPHYDHYFIWSRALIQPLRAAGARTASYLPFAYAQNYHYPSPERDPELARAISFVGTYDRARARTLETLADLPLRIYGNHWERLPRWSKLRRCVAGGALFGDELRRVISSSLASINIMRAQNAGAHNMRTFEVPAMGGLLLTTRSPEQQGFFPEGEASLMFDTPEQLRAQVQALLAGKFDVERLRTRALGLAAGNSYADRARELMTSLFR